MLNVPKLDDLSYEQIFTRAKNMIPTLTDDWTDFNYHDPGITMLQTFAWLTDMQNYYMDATGEEHWLKYLKLLGIFPKKDRAAACLISLNSSDDNISLPRGTKFNSDSIVYEINDTYNRPRNKVAQIINEVDGEGIDITFFAGKDNSYAEIFDIDQSKKCSLYVGFEKQIKDKVEFYVNILDNKRNAFNNDFMLSRVNWQYYNGQEYKDAVLLSDETCGFLKSGFISIKIDEDVQDSNYFEKSVKLYFLRCNLIKNEYDLLPQIGAIDVNCTEAFQTDTLCVTLDYVYENKDIDIDYFVGENDLLSVYVEENDEFSMWYQYGASDDDNCIVKTGDRPYNRKIVFRNKVPTSGSKIKVTITNSMLLPYINIGETSGCAKDRISLDIDNIYDLGIALIKEKDGKQVCNFYTLTENILCCDSTAKCFEYDKKSKELVFGDGIHGIQPDTSYQVIITYLKTSLLENGNILDGELNSFLSPEFKEMSVSNICVKNVGIKSENSAELKNKVVDKFAKINRAVSYNDYIDIVKNTPGLSVDLINIINPLEYNKYYKANGHKNVVYIVVKPNSNNERPVLSDNYIQNISSNLENYRLLTTEIKIIPAKYVGIEISGLIYLTENNEENKSKVTDALKEFVDFKYLKNPFGKNIVYGEIFARLETLPFINKVEKLSFERFGNGANKNDNGDIDVYPDFLTYIKDFDIEFC